MARKIVKDIRRRKRQELLRSIFERSLWVVCILAFSGGMLYFSFRLIERSGLFRIREVISTNSFEEFEGLRREFKNTSLLRVPVTAYARMLKRNHPEYKEVSLLKVFPHTLKVAIIERKPTVQILINKKYYILDDDAVIISEGAIERVGSVVELTGRTFVLSGVRKGLMVTSDEARAGILLVKELRAQRMLSRYPAATVVTIASLPTISFDMGEILINVGEPPYRDKIALLANSLLPQLKTSLNDLKQVDLRFSPPVIGYKR